MNGEFLVPLAGGEDLAVDRDQADREIAGIRPAQFRDIGGNFAFVNVPEFVVGDFDDLL